MAHPLNEKGLTLSSKQRSLLSISANQDISDAGYAIATSLLGLQNYKFESWEAGLNAEILRQNAEDILRQGYQYANNVKEAGLRVRGDQRTAMGASGFDVKSGSYDEIIGQTDYNIARNTAAIRSEAMNKYASAMLESKMSRIQSKLYKKSGKSEMLGGIFEGASKGLTGALKLSAISKYGD